MGGVFVYCLLLINNPLGYSIYYGGNRAIRGSGRGRNFLIGWLFIACVTNKSYSRKVNCLIVWSQLVGQSIVILIWVPDLNFVKRGSWLRINTMVLGVGRLTINKPKYLLRTYFNLNKDSDQWFDIAGKQ